MAVPESAGFVTAIISRATRPAIYIDARKLSKEVRSELKLVADVREPREFEAALTALGNEKASVRLDQATAADALARIIKSAGGRVALGSDPIALMKAVKNEAEISGARAAHRRDGAAVVRFLAWLDCNAPGGQLSEIDAVAALETFRRETGALKEVRNLRQEFTRNGVAR